MPHLAVRTKLPRPDDPEVYCAECESLFIQAPDAPVWRCTGCGIEYPHWLWERGKQAIRQLHRTRGCPT